MEIVRVWLPPFVVGLIVSIGGVGLAEVAGLTQDPARPSAQPTIPVRPEPSPARVEAAEAVEVEAPPPATKPTQAGEPEQERKPESDTDSEAEADSEPEPEPEPEPSPEPLPPPEPESTAEPTAELEPTTELESTVEQLSVVPADPIPTPTPEPSASPPAPILPAQRVDLANWKLTLPTGAAGHPTEIRQPQLAQFSAPGTFWLEELGRGVVFRAAAGGVTTENSRYPRSELREMTAAGATEAGWSNAQGTHAMSITQAITALPAAKPHVVAGQVHDAEDDILMIRLERNRLFVEADGDDIGVLDSNYQLGTQFTVEITATPAGIAVSYNGSQVVALSKISKGLYFKAGCYTQSNPSKGDAPEAYGEVVIYALTVRHSE